MGERSESADRPELEGLPISQLLLRRLEAVTDEDNNYLAEDVIPPIVFAIHSLEKALRGPRETERASVAQPSPPR